MDKADLNRFLAGVRKTRFIDYLDPIGESAGQAFDRRLKWAERSKDDPQHADEAAFLVENRDDLRALVKAEEAAGQGDDWDVEYGDVSDAPSSSGVRVGGAIQGRSESLEDMGTDEPQATDRGVSRKATDLNPPRVAPSPKAVASGSKKSSVPVAKKAATPNVTHSSAIDWGTKGRFT